RSADLIGRYAPASSATPLVFLAGRKPAGRSRIPVVPAVAGRTLLPIIVTRFCALEIAITPAHPEGIEDEMLRQPVSPYSTRQPALPVPLVLTQRIAPVVAAEST